MLEILQRLPISRQLLGQISTRRVDRRVRALPRHRLIPGLIRQDAISQEPRLGVLFDDLGNDSSGDGDWLVHKRLFEHLEFRFENLAFHFRGREPAFQLGERMGLIGRWDAARLQKATTTAPFLRLFLDSRSVLFQPLLASADLDIEQRDDRLPPFLVHFRPQFEVIGPPRH